MDNEYQVGDNSFTAKSDNTKEVNEHKSLNRDASNIR